MDPSDFQSDCPGELVPTQGWEEYLDDRGRKQTRLASGHAFVPEDLPPRFDREELFDLYGTARDALGELRGLAKDDLQYGRLLAAPLLLREARVSSKIEDTIATAEEIVEYESGLPARRQEAVEVSNYRRALGHGLGSELPLSTRLVCEMHAMLLDGVRGERLQPGQVRGSQNRIGGALDDFGSARFVPPPAGAMLERCMHQLELFWNRPPATVNPLIRIALAHYQFEAIHPFADGNGRLGRAIIMLSVCRSGLLDEPLLYMSGYFDRHRQEYYDRLLRTSTHGEWTEWCRFFLTGIAEQSHDSAQRLQRIREIRENAMQRLRETNAPSRVLTLVDELIARPMTDATKAGEKLGVSYPTARKYLARLEEIDFVQELTGRGHGQVWGATQIFEVIDNED